MELYKKDSAEKIANLSTTTLELLLENNLNKERSELNSEDIVEAFNIIFSQQMLQENINEICILISQDDQVYAIDDGHNLYSYFFLLPYALGFFFEFGTGQVRAAWSIGAYIQLVGSITMVSGLIFLLPVVLWAAVRTGLVEVAQLAAGRKYVVLGLFIAAALFTPPDPFTQIVVASILYGLYELTLLLVRVSEYIKGGRDE